ncbi:MAG: hypothetical protein ACKVP0_24570 [Pirellulaceae bacterium]
MKFSMRDLLFITFIVALAAGWWVDRQRLRAEVKKAEEERFYYFNELTKYRPLPTPLPPGP